MLRLEPNDIGLLSELSIAWPMTGTDEDRVVEAVLSVKGVSRVEVGAIEGSSVDVEIPSDSVVSPATKPADSGTVSVVESEKSVVVDVSTGAEVLSSETVNSVPVSVFVPVDGSEVDVVTVVNVGSIIASAVVGNSFVC
jgi:hypothetical protein